MATKVENAMNGIVLDSSAVLALLFEEPGSEKVRDALSQGIMSTVNMVEIISILSDNGYDQSQIESIVSESSIEVVPFDEVQAKIAGHLRQATRSRGLSLGDRACLALAIVQGLPVMTADRVWAELRLGVDVQLVR